MRLRRAAASLALVLLALALSACGSLSASGDHTPPTVTVVTPANASQASARNVQVTGSATDNVGVQEVSWSQNGGAPRACLGIAPFTCTIGPLEDGTNTIVVTASDTAGNLAQSSLTLGYTFPTGTTKDPFDIALDFATSVTDAQLAAFQTAAARWAQIVTQGLPSATVTVAAGACSGLPLSTFSGVIDDVRIAVQVAPIDGIGGTLGVGGPCVTRRPAGLPSFGIMRFDVADLNQLEQTGLLEDTILHEMGHVLGFGTVSQWTSQLSGTSTTDPRFVGPNAVREWQALGGSGDVPVENCQVPPGCGGSTVDSHWRETAFANELMTGFIAIGANPLSRVTVGALADLGYVVDYSAADAFALPIGIASLGTSPTLRLDFRLVTPISP